MEMYQDKRQHSFHKITDLHNRSEFAESNIELYKQTSLYLQYKQPEIFFVSSHYRAHNPGKTNRHEKTAINAEALCV